MLSVVILGALRRLSEDLQHFSLKKYKSHSKLKKLRKRSFLFTPTIFEVLTEKKVQKFTTVFFVNTIYSYKKSESKQNVFQ